MLGKIPIYNIRLCKSISSSMYIVQHCLEDMRRIYSSIHKENVYIAGKQKRKMHRANFTLCLFATVERFSDFLWSKGCWGESLLSLLPLDPLLIAAPLSQDH